MAIMTKEPCHCTFIHNAKTGGTSVTSWMKSNFDVYPTKGKMGATVPEARELLGDLGWTFCTVRNPWRWLVSWYEFKIMENIEHFNNLGSPVALRSSKKKYDRTHLEETKAYLEKGFENWLFNGGRPLQTEKTVEVDYIMKLENITEDFKLVQERLECDVPLPRLMQSVKLKPWREYYEDPKTVDFVAKTYAKDIKAFGYEF